MCRELDISCFPNEEVGKVLMYESEGTQNIKQSKCDIINHSYWLSRSFTDAQSSFSRVLASCAAWINPAHSLCFTEFIAIRNLALWTISDTEIHQSFQY
jgi:hypothetical protein